MKTSSAGREAIKRREGEKLTAYLDSAGVWTIGVGHTTVAGPPTVTKGLKITASQSIEILARDLAKVEGEVLSAVKVPLTQNEFDALVSLDFNIGPGAFKKSTLVKKLNAGDKAGAAQQFLVWNKATVGGKKVALKGLTTRREDERKQFLSGATASPKAVPKPTPKPSPIETEATVKIVQQILIEKGYNETGAADGKMGRLTKTAILAAKSENDIKPLNDEIDAAFYAALPNLPPRKLARNDAKASEIRSAIPEAKKSWLTKIGAIFGLGTLGAGTTANSILETVSPWKNTFSDIPSWVWIAIAAVVLAAIGLVAWRGERNSIEAFREGARR